MKTNLKNSVAKRIVCLILALIMNVAVMVSCNPSNNDGSGSIGGTTSDVPSDTTSSIPSDTTSDEPSDTSSDVQSDTSSDVQSDTSSDVQSDTSSDVPSDTTSDEPSDTTSDEPSDTTSDEPSDTTSDEPSDTSSDVPSGTTASTPPETTPSTPPETTSSTPPPAPLYNISMWTAYSYEKLRIEMGPPSDASNEHTLYMSRNESEGLHIGLRSDTNLSSLSVKILSGDNDHISCNFFDVKKVLELDGKQYADRCMPINGATRISLEKNKTTVIYIDFKTEVNTPPGEYPYEIAIIDKNSNVLSFVEVTLCVWDFAMPEERKFITSAGLSQNNGKTKVEHYELLLDYGLSAYRLPYDILDDRANAYMSDPRVTSFVAFYGPDNLDDATVIARYNKLKTNPVWLEKAYFYPIDEPTTTQQLQELQRQCERLRKLCPGIKICVPYYTDIQVSASMDQVEFMDQYIDFHCPKLANWDDEYFYKGKFYTGSGTNPFSNVFAYYKYGSFADRMKAIQSKGEKVLAYVCNLPELPYLNLKVNEDGINHRVLIWQMYQRDIDGFLYWHTTCWTSDWWNNVDFFGQGWYGDGILAYPDVASGIVDEIVPSIRLIILRDGIEDIELLYIAEKYLGKDWVMERANKVSKSLTSVDVTSDEFAALRIEIGNAVEQALSGK